MMRWLRQFFCTHWFDVQEPHDHEYSAGHYVGVEQRAFRVKMQLRVCSKCGLKEERRVSDPECLGWF